MADPKKTDDDAAADGPAETGTPALDPIAIEEPIEPGDPDAQPV